MDKHAFTYEQYCSTVGKNIILEETTFHNGEKKIRCLNMYKCRETGGCDNKYVLERIERIENETK